jgi:hypothetical protein
MFIVTIEGFSADLGRRANAITATIFPGHNGTFLGLSVRFNPNMIGRWNMTSDSFSQLRTRVEHSGLRGFPFIKSDIDALEHGQIEVGLSTDKRKNIETAFNAISDWINSLLEQEESSRFIAEGGERSEPP